jgi:hypothetical protein
MNCAITTCTWKTTHWHLLTNSRDRKRPCPAFLFVFVLFPVLFFLVLFFSYFFPRTFFTVLVFPYFFPVLFSPIFFSVLFPALSSRTFSKVSTFEIELLINSISSDMNGWYYATFQSPFRLIKFIFGTLRTRLRAPHPFRGSATGDVWNWINQKSLFAAD